MCFLVFYESKVGVMREGVWEIVGDGVCGKGG